MEEIWMPVFGFEGRYEVSNLGNVRGIDRITITQNGFVARIKGKPIKNILNKQTGYHSVALDSKAGYLVHRLVAEAFIGKPASEEEKTVNHIDGNKTNNRPENLEWASYAKNNRHARDRRLNRQFGERCNLTKFEKQVVAAVRLLHGSKMFDLQWVADLFKMSKEHVLEIARFDSRAYE